MGRFIVRLLSIMLFIYFTAIIPQLFATVNRELPVILQDKKVPGPETRPPIDLGPLGCPGCEIPSKLSPAQPVPTGTLSDGRPYWGTGSKDDPFRDYPDVNDPSGGINFGTVSEPKEPPAPPAAVAAAPQAPAPKAPEAQAPKTETPPPPPAKPKPLTDQEILDKKWTFWQDFYQSWENDRVAPLDQCLRNMADAKGHIDSMRKAYESRGMTPPSPDVTSPTFPPQSPDQQRALNLYNSYTAQLETVKRAQERAATTLRITRESAIFLEVPEHERVARENAERQLKIEQEKLDRIKSRWQELNYGDKYGALPTTRTTIPDPTHQPKDHRKPQRTVDAMTHKIMSGK
ncbi:MAG TPA: hypothetical protein DCY27_01365 [Desulfobacterales bacterium]|nr:hypothetical protein [Desulfobacterales bacterium]